MTENTMASCGENVSWIWEPETGTIMICGSGPMTDYEKAEEAPWHELREQIKEVVVADGVTTLGDYSFMGCVNLKAVNLSATLQVLGVYSLSRCSLIEEAVIPDGVRIIAAKVFEGCTGLHRVRIPASMAVIDMKAFNQIPGPLQVEYGGDLQAWKKIRVSVNALGNQILGKADEPEVRTEVIPVLQTARELIHRGGDGKFHVVALDLSMDGLSKKPGDSVLLIFPDGKTMMIDAGVAECRERMLEALRRLELKGLDYFTLSHPHADHVGNAMAVAEYLAKQGGHIGTYFYTGYSFRNAEPSFAAYLRERGTVMDNGLRNGDVRELGRVRMEILAPSPAKMAMAHTFTPEHLNRISLIQKFTFGEASYLTCGDLYRVDEREAIAEHGDRLKATVLKANHHGVYTSNSDEWVETVEPKVILVTSDDIGGALFEERAEQKDIGYFCSGPDGDILVTMTEKGDVEIKTAFGKTFCK